jgi:hypothetical protein
MRLWQHLLEADKRLDLTDVENADKWLASQPWGLRESAQAALPGWRDNLLALRYLARRLKGKRAAKPSATVVETEADAVLTRFLALLAVWPETSLKKSGPSSLAKNTYRGLRVIPTYQAPDRPLGIRTIAFVEWKAGFPTSEVFWWQDGELFWQLVFLSLLEDSGPALCQVCGQMLKSLTRTGRKTKQSLCKNCRWKEWHRKQPTEAKRARWNRDYETRTGV